MKNKFVLSVLGMITVAGLQSGLAQTNMPARLDAGPLELNLYVSKTAHLFHVVDQISQWSQFCHHQYVSWFDQMDGGLSEEDRKLLAEHCAIRKKHGWGEGLEQTFYTPLDLEPALAQGIKKGLLTEQEAQTERRIFLHFQARVERLMAEEAPALRRFTEELSGQQSNLVVFANTLSRFAGCARLTVPFYLIANPADTSIGGGYNGGRLTLEIARKRDTYPSLLHELFHAFMRTKEEMIESAALSTPGLDAETLNEGLAYAYNPGIVHTGDSDPLLANVAGYLARGSSLKDSYTRFNTYGLALRPLLQEAILDKRQTLESFLPRAADAWLVLAELDKARNGKPDAQGDWSKHDFRKDPQHSNFVFTQVWDDELAKILIESVPRHCFSRNHVAAQYEEMLTKNAKPGDTIILLLSLNDENARVPKEFSDLLPSPWTEIEGRLKQGQTVFIQGQARDMTVYLLATPTTQALRSEFRKLAAEGKFSADGTRADTSAPAATKMTEFRTTKKDGKNVTITKAYWFFSGDRPQTIPEDAVHPQDDGHFLIHVDVSFDDLKEIYPQLGKEFLLSADGHGDIHARAERGYWGSECYLRIPPEEYAKMEPGIPYALKPLNQDGNYRWVVGDNIRITKMAVQR